MQFCGLGNVDYCALREGGTENRVFWALKNGFFTRFSELKTRVLSDFGTNPKSSFQTQEAQPGEYCLPSGTFKTLRC